MAEKVGTTIKRLRKEKDFAQFHPGGSLGRRLLTQVKDVMRKDNLPIIDPNMKIAEALTVISEGCLGMAVVMNDNELLGLVTDGDIRRTFQAYGKDSFDILVKEIMVTSPIVVHGTDKLITIDAIFKEKKVHTLVVLDSDEHFIGFVSFRDCII